MENSPEKLALNFYLEENRSVLPISSALSQRAKSCIDELLKESASPTQLSAKLIENNVFELIAIFMRLLGMRETVAKKSEPSENILFSLAKQYISDNICRAPAVSDVAAHCHINTKQLTRIFSKEGISPARYIRKMRLDLCENLLLQRNCTLSEISEKMNFSSEYYFNAFFKKSAGMTPGEYRRANRRDL